jgi:2,4-dienoyl-CoA reductase-like NADH-dependent reductase (Old Yellow Enzyme family)
MSLFTPFTIKSVTFRNRILVSPMCQYSSVNGLPNEWHLTHLGSRAIGGAAAVIVEASGVTPEGRITPDDMGIWSDVHAAAFRPITRFLKSHGTVPGIQLAHAGRKGSTYAPWKGEGSLKHEDGAWTTLAPSAIPFHDHWQVPQAVDGVGIKTTIADFGKAAQRAFEAGFEFVEIHAAHGYLLNQFLSPLSNHRKDEYGGSLENRMRFPLEVAAAVRQAWPENLPLAVRISATDWVEGGWTLEESVELAKRLKALGVDLVDCSSGGSSPHAKIPVGPGYQVPFAEKIKKEAGIDTIAVGLITEPAQADAIIQEGRADFVALARAFLRDPYWALNAAHTLGVEVTWPVQYLRAKPRR